jgi:hypothetical protein
VEQGGVLYVAAEGMPGLCIHSRIVKTSGALQKRVDGVKQAVAARWKNVGNINVSLQRQAEFEEVRVGVLEVRRSAAAELNAMFKEAGATHARTESQRDFYASPVVILNRMSLGDARRNQYSEQLHGAGQAEPAHLGWWAVSTGNHALAAAIDGRDGRLLDRLEVACEAFAVPLDMLEQLAARFDFPYYRPMDCYLSA